MSDDETRLPWTEEPDGEAPPESWLGLEDDDLLHRIETVDPRDDIDARLLEVVSSHRHFFIRQEAAKRVRSRKALFPYEDDRHVGQILVRHLTRREDLTYLERLVTRSRHVEVRNAARVQLARLRQRLQERGRHQAAASRGPIDATPWRISIVHADPSVSHALAAMLAAPEFVVRISDPSQPEIVEAFEPDLLLLGQSELEREPRFHSAVHGPERHAPLVVLCAANDVDRFPAARSRGADDFLVLPASPALLEAKTRALLHLAHVGLARGEIYKATGLVGEDGIVALLRLCEDEGLSCRLVVITPEARYFADFVDGEMTEAGGIPAVEEHEAFGAMLAVRAGRYEIHEAPAAAPSESAAAEAVAATLTTVIAEEAATPDGTGAMGAPPAPAPNGVDATLLGWAVHFIVEGAWAHLGTAVTGGLLKRTQQECLDSHPTLRAFTVGENAHVQVDLAQGLRLPPEAVSGAASWMVAFLAASRRIAHEVGLVDVREITRLVGQALEHVGFYVAFDAATSVAARTSNQSRPVRLRDFAGPA